MYVCVCVCVCVCAFLGKIIIKDISLHYGNIPEYLSTKGDFCYAKRTVINISFLLPDLYIFSYISFFVYSVLSFFVFSTFFFHFYVPLFLLNLPSYFTLPFVHLPISFPI